MKVLVVGAGVGGLAVAARLAALGHDVTVCERSATTGGKLAGYRRDGFTFDTGPSLLTLPQAFRDLFLKTGAPLEDVLDLAPVNPLTHHRFPDGSTLALPTGSVLDVRTAVTDALGAEAAEDWQALLERAGAIWQVTRVPFVESPLDGWRALRRLARRQPRDIATIAPWATLRGLGRRHLRDPRLRMLLERYATYSGSDPRRAPAALGVIAYVEHAFGGWHVRGGLHRLAAALHDRAVATGADIRCGSPVTGLHVTGGRVSGVEVNGEVLRADLVVTDTDARVVYGEWLPGAKVAVPGRPSYSGFTLLLALRGRAPRPHHTVLFPDDYDAEFDALRRGRPVPSPAVYVAAPDDPAMAPPGHDAWVVLVNAPRHEPHGGTDWTRTDLVEEYADRVLAVMAARGLDVRDRVLWRVVRTPADIERETASPGGAIYGSSSDGLRAAFLRPANASPVPGLFLVGGSAHPGGGLPLVALSAAIVAEQVGRA